MLPTFLIAGAPKAGTTSLWEYLKSHPQVEMGILKEPMFFTQAVGTGQVLTEKAPRFSGRYHLGLDWYQGLFQECKDAKAVGEASGLYFTEPDAPGLISQHLPAARIIFILRDPVERLYSHYWQDVKMRFPLPDFEDLVAKAHPALGRYVYVSLYHLHLERYRQVFPCAQLKVVLYDDLRDRPRDLLREVYEFIGVDPAFEPPFVGKIFNPRSVYRSFMVYFAIRRINFWWVRFFRREPPLIWSRLIERIDALNLQKMNQTPLSKELRAHFLPQFREATEYVENFLQCTLPGWKQV